LMFKNKRDKKNEEIINSAEKVGEELMPMVSENIKQKMALAEVVWVDEDMRLSHVSTAKIIKDMFNFYSFLKEHGATMMLILGVLVMAISMVLVFSSISDFYKDNAKMSEMSGILANRLEEINKNSVDVIVKLNDLTRNINDKSVVSLKEELNNSEEYLLLSNGK